MQGSFKKADEAEGVMTAALQENLTGIRVVRAFARQEFEIGRFTRINANYRDRHWHLFRIMALYWSTSDLMCFTQFAAIVIVGARRASHGHDDHRHHDRVHLVRPDVHLAHPRGRTRPDRIGQNAGFHRADQGSAGRRRGTTAGAPESSATLAFAVKSNSVTSVSGMATNGCFAMFRCRFPAGTTLALLGPSGSGKTTLVNLLLRIYDHDRGTITLDGIELKSLDRKYVRGQFGVVLQEPFLYSKTLRENIKLGRHAGPG